jgi:putative transposase
MRKLVDGLLVDLSVSVRRACQALRFETSSYHYKSRRTGQAGLELRLREICETRVRYGYRRIHVLLRREGWQVNIKKTRRIYNELGLQLRNKHPKRRVKAKLREERQAAAGPNEVWAMDFVHDKLALGKKLRILTIVDIHSRYCPAVDPRFAYHGEDVVQTLERVCRQIGYPQTIRVNNGSEFISRDLDLWAYANEVTQDFSPPGKPTDRAIIRHWSEDNGEGLHRGLQQQAAGRMPERRLVHGSCGCPRKVGGLAQRLQRGPALTARSDTTCRSICIFPVAPPARPRDQSRETPARGGPYLESRAGRPCTDIQTGPLGGGSPHLSSHLQHIHLSGKCLIATNQLGVARWRSR